MLMSAIYASSSPLLREDLWNYLIDIGHLISMPWILIGDFNQILYLEEKKVGQWRFKEESNRLGIWFRAAIYLILVSPVHPLRGVTCTVTEKIYRND